MSEPGTTAASESPAVEPKDDIEKRKLADEVSALKLEVKKWKSEAEDAKALAGQAVGDSQSAAESKAKDLAKKNRDLNLKVQKLQDELNRSKAGGAGAPTTGASDHSGPLTYSMKKAQAKAEQEAQAEIKKYKGLYDNGAARIARLQQEVECQKITLEKNEKSRKELQGKVALLTDQLESYKSRSKSPDVDSTGKARKQMNDEDRSGLTWKVRHSEAVAELKDLKEELAEVRMAAEGALARREVLEAQIKRAREQVKQLLAKSDDDDSLIRTLHSRLTAQGNSSEATSEALEREAEELRRKCAQQETQINAQEKIINALHSQTAVAQTPHAAPTAPSTVASIPGSEQLKAEPETEVAG